MPWSPESRAAAAERMRRRWHDGKMIAALNRPEVREKMIAAAKAAAARPEVREKMIAAAKAAAARPEVREKRIAALKARRDPWLDSLTDEERALYVKARIVVGARQARADIERMRSRQPAAAAQ